MTAILIVLGIILLICLANSGSEKPKKSKAEAEKELLWKLRRFSRPEAYDKAFELFEEYPEYDLELYPPFKSWYKTFIDDWHKDGCVKLKNGGKYHPENDPLYDPNAPDWFGTYHIFRDYDDEDDNDDDGEDLVAKVLEERRLERMTSRERSDYDYQMKMRRKNQSF